MRRGRSVFFFVLFMLTAVWTGIAQQVQAEQAFTLHARSAVLMDGDSGRILYGKEENNPLPMASTTKIMTCIVALEQADPKLVCTASEHAAAQPQVKLGMRKGDEFYLKDLLYSLMLESHNDTAVCIAESVAGSVEDFATLMNEKAAELGCVNTYYITPNGLDAEDAKGMHHTTAAELAKVLRYCITQSPKAEAFLEVTQTVCYCFSNIAGNRSFSCTNHNAFLSMMDGAITGKTGFTGKAGYCYVGALKRGERLYIVSLLACGWPNNKIYKWADTRKLMNYGLDNFEKRNVTDPGMVTGNILVENGQAEMVSSFAEQKPLQILMRSDEKVTSELELAGSLNAPVKRGQEVGEVRYYLNGAQILSFPVLAAADVAEVDFQYCLEQIAASFLL